MPPPLPRSPGNMPELAVAFPASTILSLLPFTVQEIAHPTFKSPPHGLLEELGGLAPSSLIFTTAHAMHRKGPPLSWSCASEEVMAPSSSSSRRRKRRSSCPRPPLHSWAALLLLLLSVRAPGAHGGASEVAVRFLKTPRAFSALTSATFQFEVLEGSNADLCSDCSVTCKLDNYSSSNCKSRQVSYTALPDGDHIFEVCVNGSQGIHCASYKWAVDTVSPTAYVSAATPFTNALNVSVHISFSEPCAGRGGFRCSISDCNLLVYGSGNALPSTLKVLQPDLEFSLIVVISADVLYGRLVLVMDKSFCTDAAGNMFMRTSNSSFILHFDRRSVLLNLRTHIPQKLLQFNGETRIAEATNNEKNLRIYLYFSDPVFNTSTEILSVLHTSSGSLLPTNIDSLGNRRFGYQVSSISNMAIFTITCDASSIISRQGTPVSPSDPVTFLYDAQRPSVVLSTTSYMRTREHKIPVLIRFEKPVFDFNSSSVSISGGHLLSFHEVTKSTYTINLHIDNSIMSIEVPENTAGDIAGNKNLASNRLEVRHYSIPSISLVISTITTTVYAATSITATLLSISTASLLSSGVFSRSSTHLVSEPSRNLMRIACHIQVFALSKWLTVAMPIEYYEFARAIEWSIPYLSLPWETGGTDSFIEGSGFSLEKYLEIPKKGKLKALKSPSMGKGYLETDDSVYGMPLSPIEYRSFLESQKPEAEFLTASRNSTGWKCFGRNMFWLAVIGGGLLVLRATLLLTLKFKRMRSEEKQKEFGALVFPRFEIFLILLALPCFCQAAATVILGKRIAGVIVGILLLGMSSFLLLSLLLFLSLGITMGKLLQYKEVHEEGQEFHWYQEIIRVSLGPGKRGQWTWKEQPNSTQLTKLGPLFEDLRGPPKYMLSQISGGGSREKRGDQIIASDDETEDAEAPFIQKLFGIMRIYYTFLECVKRASLGIVAGVYSSSTSSKVPTVVVLSITSFQLFFLVLKKPFIKKKVQFVEIISVASEVGAFGACLVLLEKNFSDAGERRVGLFMLGMFIIGFAAQMMNEWYALYRQILCLSPADNSLSSGLKAALTGLLLFVLPGNLSRGLDVRFPATDEGDKDAGPPLSPSGRIRRSSSMSEKPWLRQLRELAKASFSRNVEASPNDPSSSGNKWSGFWSGKRSGSSSVTLPADLKTKADPKAKSRGLYKDLEAIFSSK